MSVSANRVNLLPIATNGVPLPEAAQFSTGEITPVLPSAIAEAVPTVKPRFTLPVNATLLDNTAMTAFIGRVPVNGTVQDPYRFKILVKAWSRMAFAAAGRERHGVFGYLAGRLEFVLRAWRD